MTVFILQKDDFFLPNLETRLYKLYDLKLQSKNILQNHDRLKIIPGKLNDILEDLKKDNKEEQEDEIKDIKEDKEEQEDETEDPKDDKEEEKEDNKEEQEDDKEDNKEEPEDEKYHEYLKKYIIENVKVTIPNHGQVSISILDDLITWSEFVQIELTDDDLKRYSGRIKLSEISTYTNTIYIHWNEQLAQYCWYTFTIYFEKYLSPMVVITDWLAKYLTIETAWSQYYKIDFDKIPSGIPIPTYEDLLNIPIPDSIGLLNHLDTGNYFVTTVGGMTSSAILSSLLYTRKKIIDIGMAIHNITNNLTALRSGLSTMEPIASLQTAVNFLKSSNTSSSANITTLRNAINENSANIASLQSAVNALTANVYLLQSKKN